MLKTVIITGANSGLGLECARNIARASKDYQIILACRNKEKAEAAKRDIIKTTQNDNIVAMELDVSSMQSVRSFVQEFKMSAYALLYALVCNAGISGFKESVGGKSNDGFEQLFATNYLGHFLLCVSLLPIMEKDARIAMVSSDMHNPPGGVTWPGAASLAHSALPNNVLYSLSKLCSLYFTYELAARLKAAHSNISINAFNPGLMTDTNLFADKSAFNESFLKAVADRVGSLKTSAQFLADMVTEQKYKGVCGVYVDRGQIIKSSALSYDKANARELWDESVKLCKLNKAETLPGII